MDYRKTNDPILKMKLFGITNNLITEKEAEVLRLLFRLYNKKQRIKFSHR